MSDRTKALGVIALLITAAAVAQGFLWAEILPDPASSVVSVFVGMNIGGLGWLAGLAWVDSRGSR